MKDVNLDEETTEKFSPLTKVKLRKEDRIELLNSLRREMSATKPKRKFNMGFFSQVTAAVAAVLVVGGVGFEIYSAHMQSRNSQVATTAGSSNITKTTNNSIGKSTNTTARYGGTTQPLNSLSMVNSETGWATGHDSVWSTRDGGTHWENVTPKALPNSKELQIRVFGLSDKQAWIAVANNSSAGNSVGMFHTSNGGVSWTEQRFPGVGAPITLHFRNISDGWIALMQGGAAGSEGETIYDTNNGGTTWRKVGVASNQGGSLPFGGDKTGASFLDQNHGWATGFIPISGSIYLYRTIDGGTEWRSQPVTVPSKLKGAGITSYPPIFFGHQDGILPVSDGSLLVYRTTDGGQTWVAGKVEQSSTKNEPIRNWSFPTFHDGVATDGNMVFETTNGGQTWSSFTPNISLSNVSEWNFTSSTSGWALMSSGVLYHTTDGGHTWTKE